PRPQLIEPPDEPRRNQRGRELREQEERCRSRGAPRAPVDEQRQCHRANRERELVEGVGGQKPPVNRAPQDRLQGDTSTAIVLLGVIWMSRQIPDKGRVGLLSSCSRR